LFAREIEAEAEAEAEKRRGDTDLIYRFRCFGSIIPPPIRVSGDQLVSQSVFRYHNHNSSSGLIIEGKRKKRVSTTALAW
jgi:hypothetical protein